MAGLAMAVTVGNTEALATITELVRRVDDPHVALQAGGIHMLRSIQQNFDQSGRPGHWAPNAPSTILKKGSSKPLIDTGAMMGAIRYEATQATLALSSSLVQSRIQQLGGRTGRGHAVTIPARPFLVFQDDDLDVIAEIIGDYVAGQGR